MRTILCYGDSNTFGVAVDRPHFCGFNTRYDERWTMTLSADLGAEYRVIEEGLGGRTTVYGTGDVAWKNGEPYLYPCLLSHRPLNLVAIMLGTNDLRVEFGVTEDTLGDGVERLIDIIQACPKCGYMGVPPKILVIAPTLLTKPEVIQSGYNDRGGERGERLSQAFAEKYRAVAEKKGCYFMDCKEFALPLDKDGMHLGLEAHVRLGHAVADKIREIYANE